MVSIETFQPTPPPSIDQLPNSSPRISFSAEFLDESNFISISPTKPLQQLQSQQQKPDQLDHHQTVEKEKEKEHQKPRAADFEFLSNTTTSSHDVMLTADELFFEGKLLPFWQMQQSEKLHKINLKSDQTALQDNNSSSSSSVVVVKEQETGRVWFVDDDPSPRPPKCTVLWKELLKLKKQRANSSLSPSSSSSSTSSSSSSLGDAAVLAADQEAGCNKKTTKRVKKGLERTRSATIRIRPMINVPICTQMKSSALPPLFPIKKGRLER